MAARHTVIQTVIIHSYTKITSTKNTEIIWHKWQVHRHGECCTTMPTCKFNLYICIFVQQMYYTVNWQCTDLSISLPHSYL